MKTRSRADGTIYFARCANKQSNWLAVQQFLAADSENYCYYLMLTGCALVFSKFPPRKVGQRLFLLRVFLEIENSRISGLCSESLRHIFDTEKQQSLVWLKEKSAASGSCLCISIDLHPLQRYTTTNLSRNRQKKHRARLLKTHFRPFFMIVEQIIVLGQEALRRTIFPIAWNVDVFLFIYSASFSAVAQFPNSFAAFGSGQDFSSRRFCLASNNKERARDDREDAARKYFDRHHSARWSADLSGY